MEHHLNLPRVKVWCGISALGILGPFFFDQTVTGDVYRNLLQESTVPRLAELFGDEEIYCQQEHLLTTTVMSRPISMQLFWPDRWLGQRGSIEFLVCSPDLTPPDFFLWGYLKDKVYGSKPATVNELKVEIERQCLAIPNATIHNTVQSIGSHYQLCLESGCCQFEHL